MDSANLQRLNVLDLKLLEVCDVKASEISANDISSKIAPRLNSLGRIADPEKGVELLLERDPKVAEALAKDLDENNTERQRIERVDSEDIERVILEFYSSMIKLSYFILKNGILALFPFLPPALLNNTIALRLS